MVVLPQDFEPKFFLYHRGSAWAGARPRLRATFSSAADAYIWQRGNMGQPYADLFFITDHDGRIATFEQNRYGHAHAILDAARPE